MAQQTQPTDYSQEFKGQVALVTGASRGLGRDAALALARAGADVVCVATTAENAQETAAAVQALGRKAVALGARVENAAEVDACFTAAEKALGVARIVVNNAGIADPKPILDITEADYDRVMDINLKGVFLCAQRAARALRDSGKGGSIINIGSMAGINGFPNRSTYCASKAAVHHLTKVMAIEWAPLGVRANAIAPGYIRTDLVQGLIDRGVVDEAKLSARAPVNRLGEVNDISQAVLYLASERASFVTGTVLTVDGGWTAYGFL